MKVFSENSFKLFVLSNLVLILSISSVTFGQKTEVSEYDLKSIDSYKHSDPGNLRNNRRRGRNNTPTPTPTPTSTPTITPEAKQKELAGMNGIKFFLDKDAWYYVSSQELSAHGFDINSSSEKWQLYSNGVEIPFFVNPDNSIEFYGKGTDTLHSNSKVYYLVVGAVNGLRIPQISGGNGNQTPDIESFQSKTIFKERSNYLPNILNGGDENWFGSVVSLNGNTISIDTPKLDADGNANLVVKLQGLSASDHLVNIRINDFDLGTVSYSDDENYQHSFDLPASELNDGENQVTFQAIGAGSDYSLLDSVELYYQRKYEADGNRFKFNVPSGQVVQVNGLSGTDIKVYEISDGYANNQLLVESETINGTVGFSLAASSVDRELFAVSNNDYESPWKIEQNHPSSWNNNTNQAAFIIISPSILSESANALSTRRNADFIKTEVVLTEDIADEYGFGIITPEAIREFLSEAKTNWQQKPEYVLLFGDSSFDMRNYLGNEDRNLVPTKLVETFDMETTSDAWLVDFNNDGIEDISIGRIPAGNTAEASKAFEKIVRYETENLNMPRSAVLNADFLFETLNGELEALLPNNVASQRIERSVLGDSQMRADIISNANNNPTFVSYLGHGTTGVWSTGNVFGITEAENLTNEKLSFYMLMTCLNGYTSNAYSQSLAESLVLADNAAIAVWASSGSTYASGQIEMGQDVLTYVFASRKKAKRVGDAVRIAKHSSGSWDARQTWKLLGDPTMYIR